MIMAAPIGSEVKLAKMRVGGSSRIGTFVLTLLRYNEGPGMTT
jgi:hypothetical protein